jgi:hypothetical protein
MQTSKQEEVNRVKNNDEKEKGRREEETKGF